MAETANFRWLPIGWPPKESVPEYAPLPDQEKANVGDPFVSFRVDRRLPSKGNVDEPAIDQTIVLLASEWLEGHFLGSGFGIRVVAHVRQLESKKYQLRFTGLTASLPFRHFSTQQVWEMVNGEKYPFVSIFASGQLTLIQSHQGICHNHCRRQGWRGPRRRRRPGNDWRDRGVWGAGGRRYFETVWP